MKMRQEKQSSMAAVALFVFIIALLKDSASGIAVDVTPKNQMVKLGEKFTFMCKVAMKLQYCSITLPGSNTRLNMNENTANNSNYWYEGKGLERGQCGITIARTDDKYNGQFRCSLGIPGQASESDGFANLTVARAPPFDPVLVVSPETGTMFQDYSENTVISAMCTVKDARPAASLSWYIGDARIKSGIGRTEIVESPNDLFTVQQNLTRTLTWNDNGKILKCMASHFALDNIPKQTIKQINVKFAPRPIPGQFEQYGFIVGVDGLITVPIHANPQPSLTWTVDNEHIAEGKKGTTRFEAQKIGVLGNGTWTAELRITGVTAEDLDRQYVLTARNIVGEREYKVKIFTDPERPGTRQRLPIPDSLL